MNKLIPQTKDELIYLIQKEIHQYGHECDLNHIDISHIHDLSYLFSHVFTNMKFNGNISKWDVSHVKKMSYMFQDSQFNQDISSWNVSSVQNMDYMFRNSSFTQNIDNWRLKSLQYHQGMFDSTTRIKPLWFYDDVKLIKNYLKKMNLQKTLQHQLITRSHDLNKSKL